MFHCFQCASPQYESRSPDIWAAGGGCMAQDWPTVWKPQPSYVERPKHGKTPQTWKQDCQAIKFAWIIVFNVSNLSFLSGRILMLPFVLRGTCMMQARNGILAHSRTWYFSMLNMLVDANFGLSMFLALGSQNTEVNTGPGLQQSHGARNRCIFHATGAMSKAWFSGSRNMNCYQLLTSDFPKKGIRHNWSDWVRLSPTESESGRSFFSNFGALQRFHQAAAQGCPQGLARADKPMASYTLTRPNTAASHSIPNPSS